MMEDEESVFAAVRAGARGYLLKGARRPEIVRSIEAVGAGEVIFGPGIAERMMTYFRGARSKPAADVFPQLTERERVVLALIAAGLENAEIARELGSPSRRCATTRATSSRSCRSRTAPRPSCWPARPGWSDRASRSGRLSAAAVVDPGVLTDVPAHPPGVLGVDVEDLRPTLDAVGAEDDAGRHLRDLERRDCLGEPVELDRGERRVETAQRGELPRSMNPSVSSPPRSERRMPFISACWLAIRSKSLRGNATAGAGEGERLVGVERVETPTHGRNPGRMKARGETTGTGPMLSTIDEEAVEPGREDVRPARCRGGPSTTSATSSGPPIGQRRVDPGGRRPGMSS